MARTAEDTSIPLKKSTRERLGTFGNKNESWDKVLNRLMNEIEDKKNYAKMKKDMEECKARYEEEIASLNAEIDSLQGNFEETE